MLTTLLKALNTSSNITLPTLGGIMKMGNSYMFNEFLKFNDGKLSKFIQENEGLSENDANAKIDGFVAEIKSALETKGNFSLNEIGTLILKDGKILLEKLPTTSTPKTEIKKETAKVEVKKEIPAPKQEIKKEVIPPKKTEKKPLEEKQSSKNENTSTELAVKDAKEKINSLKDKQELIDFTKGDARKTIIEALNKQLKTLNKIDTNELNILEATAIKKTKEEVKPEKPIKEGTQKEVKKQVAKESDILKTVVEKESQDTPEKTPSSSNQDKELKKVEPSKPPVKKDKKPTFVVQEKETKKEVSEEEDLAALTEGAIKLEKEAKGRKRNKIILWAAIICILSGGGIVGYLKKDNIMALFETSTQIAESTTTPEEEVPEIMANNDNEANHEEVTIDEISEPVETVQQELVEGIIEEPIEEEVIEEETIAPEDEPIEEISVSHSESGNYLVVVGSFSKEKNAINLVKELKKEGYSNAGIFQNGNLQSVKIGSYSTSKEAKAALQESGKDGWVKRPR